MRRKSIPLYAEVSSVPCVPGQKPTLLHWKSRRAEIDVLVYLESHGDNMLRSKAASFAIASTSTDSHSSEAKIQATRHSGMHQTSQNIRKFIQQNTLRVDKKDQNQTNNQSPQNKPQQQINLFTKRGSR